ncbi:amino acid adenylation domain-containing protein [Paenibacillus sp. sptzw28]|uniref:non-ribosomal peptide synthetase family protein n=1 Tax=Paenibacillus sp. sptzw28 TaxID=715179 RepID=UPI001C6EF27A|nr:non-ribosomal peptide synthetase [Paenibacillus sp. sptzw28]QYR23254.1 amino acid adenylation domain-containing protein [Paenibacillus sp. sptzw28]
MVTVNTTNKASAPVSEMPVLLIPLDYSRHNRTHNFLCDEYPLDEPLDQVIREWLLKENEAESFFASVYFALIYRLSGESDMLVELVAKQAPGVPVHVSLQSERTFQTIQDSVARSLSSGGQPSVGAAETRFAFGQYIKAEHELINWRLFEEDKRWSIGVEYDSSVVTRGTIARYVHYFVKLLEAALEDSSASIASIDILTEEDKAVHQRLNATEGEYDRDQTIHGMVEKTAEKYPEQIAVSSLQGQLTYRQLNERANQAAHMLLEKGLRKGDFVTILMERSMELVVSLLGVLKAGGAYVPVDPEHPGERNRYIVEDTKSLIVMTKEGYSNQAAELCSGIASVKEIICVDGGFERYASKGDPQTAVTPQDLAYIIYTSGSTGRPKGALIAHEGVVNLGEVVRRDCRIEAIDVLTQFATFSFDASVWDTIGALFYGATLYLLSPEERVSVEEFASAVERTGTTIIAILPTVFFNQLAAYLSEDGYRKLSRVKLITVAGEALYGEQVRAFQRKFRDGIDIVNVYGPTECTVCTTTHIVRGYIPEDLKNIPIGKPIQNYKIYIVNEENRLCPLNVHGEVYISTVGLARGYLNQPEKTAEAFIPNPFQAGERIYKSGDIAKLLPDGNIEYVGRRDSQIKIRGHRIEIGEIEDSFSKITNVQNVAVIPKQDKDGQNILVGYFTSKDGKAESVAEIKQLLGEKLPSYFVPKRVIQLDEMPISPTGKIDRKKLAGYEHNEEHQESGEYAAPENETQRIIAAAWQEGLGLGQISLYDDFFAIGGDSLAIISVLVLLKPHFPELRINDFFQYKTIEGLSRRVVQLQSDRTEIQYSVPQGAVQALEEHPAVLDRSLLERNFEEAADVLLTGATGYLGCHLLYEMLVQSQASIYCLVRINGSEPGMARLESTMEYYYGPHGVELMKGRVFEVEGNLEQPGLGLGARVRQLLQEKLDTILHCAADVRHFGDADQFAKTNVHGTQDLIELALECVKVIRFHHISTLGIPEDLALSGKWESIVEKQEFEAELRIDSVYTNSKLEAEKSLIAAAERGLAVSIYRAGNLSCSSETGRFQKNIDSNAFYRMIKAILLLGKSPDVNWEVDLTPIDYASKSIVHLALRPDTSGRMFHICNPKQIPYSRLVELIRSCGFEVEMMDSAAYTEWLLDHSINKHPEGVKLAIAGLEGDGAKNSGYRYGCRATSEQLKDSQINCALPDRTFINKMIEYAVNSGYFPKPNMLQQVK